MQGFLRLIIIPAFVFAAGLFFFVGADRYAMHIQSSINYAWPARPQHATIIFGGDMMFDRSIRSTIYARATAIVKAGGLPAEASAQAGDFIFSCIDPVLRAADLVVANLEGPITEHASVSASSTPGDEFNYTFTFATSTAPLLFSHNIRAVNLGNNHILNFGWEGARSTTEYLQDAGIAYFGLPAESAAFETTLYGIRFSFINYNEFALSPHTNKLEFVSMLSNTIGQIRAAHAAGEIPIVYTHWGIEYATTSSAYSRELAHSFIDAGAEIVIGSHPHVVEEHEMYKGKHVYYSLGNFIFDQYWNDDVRHGLLLRVTFGTDGVLSVKEIPVYLESDRRTCPVIQ